MDFASPILAIFALLISFSLLVRSRRRIKCLENEMKVTNIHDVRKRAESEYNENRLVKLVDLCRELEAKVQNRAILLEKLIEDADKKLQALDTVHLKKGEQARNPIHDRLEELEREGKNDTEISKILNRSEAEIKLIRSLVKTKYGK